MRAIRIILVYFLGFFFVFTVFSVFEKPNALLEDLTSYFYYLHLFILSVGAYLISIWIDKRDNLKV